MRRDGRAPRVRSSTQAATAGGFPAWTWMLFAAALAIAWVLRTVDLPLKPLHSDEGVNGWYSLRLWWTGFYQYQASDYHGPMLYYVNSLAFRLLGASDVTLRLGTAVVGVVGVAALALFRRPLGALGVAAAALVMALQPVDVYFSRTVIHEVHMVTGTLLFAGAGLQWLRRGGYGLAVLSGFGLAVMLANKETAVISIACVVVPATALWLCDPWLRDGTGGGIMPARGRREILSVLASRWRQLLVGTVCLAVVMATFYSSLFTYWAGLKGIFSTYYYWIGYGVSGRNQKKEFLYWIQFWPYVWPALAVGLPELVVGALKRERFALLIGGWFLLGWLVYSLIPYKTPWCFVEISLPLVLLAGAGLARAARYAQARMQAAGLPVATNRRPNPFSDHFPFTVHGVPALWYYRENFPGGRWQHHSPHDNLENVSVRVVAEVVEAAAALIADVASGETLPFTRGPDLDARGQTLAYARELYGGIE